MNLKSNTSKLVLWKVAWNSPHVAGVLALADGYHELAPTPTSGALDAIRHPTFAQRLLCALLQWTKVSYLVRPAPELVLRSGRIARSASGGRPSARAG